MLKKQGLLLLAGALLVTAAGCTSPPAAAASSAKPVSEITEGAPDTVEESGKAVWQEGKDNAADTSAQNTQAVWEIALSVNGTPLTVLWQDNQAVKALAEWVKEDVVTIRTENYGGFEQVGALPWSLPADDAQMTAKAGDIVLYSGNSIVLFYGPNTWRYTKLGQIKEVSAEELETLLSDGQTTVTLSAFSQTAAKAHGF